MDTKTGIFTAKTKGALPLAINIKIQLSALEFLTLSENKLKPASLPAE